MKRNITSLYDDYRKGRTSRRDFIKKLTMAAGSTAAAMALLPVLEENSLNSPESLTQDGLKTDMISYPASTGAMQGFIAYPEKGKKFPAVIVIHENRGLQPHIKDVTRRMAGEGFLALAPDALSPLGGTPDNDSGKAGTMMRELNSEETVKNFVAAVKYLETHPKSTGKVGCTGFCWGGAMTNQVAVNSSDLDAAVPYYGRQPAAEDVARIKSPVMAHYAGNDPGINAGIEAFEQELKKQNKEYQIFMYEGASHAFNNDSNPERYNEQAAKLAWGRTIAFFKEKLK